MKQIKTESGKVTYNNQTHSFFLENHTVKIFNEAGRINSKENVITIGKAYPTPSKSILGKTVDQCNIIFFPNEIYYSFNADYVYFGSNFCIKGESLIEGPSISDKFRKLEFTGPVINTIHDCQKAWFSSLAVEHKNASTVLKSNGIDDDFVLLRKTKDTLFELEVIIDERKAKLSFVVSSRNNGIDLANPVTSPMVALSKVVLEFEEDNNVENIKDIYLLFKDVFSFLTRNRDIDFDVKVFSHFREAAHCLGDVYIYSETLKCFAPRMISVISLRDIKDSIQLLITNIEKQKINTFHLPNSNSDRSYINTKDIVDICTVAESVFSRNKKNKERTNELCEELNTVVEKHFSENKINKKEKDYFIGNLQHLSLPAAEQFEIIYNIAKPKMSAFLKRFKEVCKIPIKQLFDEIVSVRNKIMHAGKTQVVLTQNHSFAHYLLSMTVLTNDLILISASDDLINGITQHICNL